MRVCCGRYLATAPKLTASSSRLPCRAQLSTNCSLETQDLDSDLIQSQSQRYFTTGGLPPRDIISLHRLHTDYIEKKNSFHSCSVLLYALPSNELFTKNLSSRERVYTCYLGNDVLTTICCNGNMIIKPLSSNGRLAPASAVVSQYICYLIVWFSFFSSETYYLIHCFGCNLFNYFRCRL
jgi:hypothetical protein